MVMEKQEIFIHYLDRRISAATEKVNRLISDKQRKEADFENIRTNTYRILKTMFRGLALTSQNEAEQIGFFAVRLFTIEKWKDTLAKALEHNNERRILQEQIRLETMEEIRSVFEMIWGNCMIF